MDDNAMIGNLKYLRLLSEKFPTPNLASREIINLEAILNLPKGTEHFMSDIHGEDEAFLHILKSGSGIIRKKVDDVFKQSVTALERRKLAILIYYPEQVLHKLLKQNQLNEEELKDWYGVTIHRLIMVLKEVSSKYTRSKVRKALPGDFEYIIEELLYQREHDQDKNHYYNQILNSIIEIGRAKDFIVGLSRVISRLAVDHLHIIGDIYDRGPNPDIIMDSLQSYHTVDIQWGNHDIVWMGAASGSTICILTVIRNCARYGALNILEENYGINILPIAKYAIQTIRTVEPQFLPLEREGLFEDEVRMAGQINKAVSILLFKYEALVAKRNPEFEQLDRCLLERIDYDRMEIELEGKVYRIQAEELPNIDPVDPTALSEEEKQVIGKLRTSFLNNPRLQSHVSFLFEKGSIYKVFNNNLLFHGCIPLDQDGTYTKVTIQGQTYQGKELLDKYEKMLRVTYAKRHKFKTDADTDIFWYLWAGKNSSLFGKDRMTTFERTLIADKETHKENKNNYYKYILEEEICIKILQDFGITDPRGRIINGHVPVKVSKGESPVKSGGRLIVIDGGLSKAYQEVTGIAGYTLIYNSHGMLLAAHEPFVSAVNAYNNNAEMLHELSIVEAAKERILVGDTDSGKKIQASIEDLKQLLLAYDEGYIKTSL